MNRSHCAAWFSLLLASCAWTTSEPVLDQVFVPSSQTSSDGGYPMAKVQSGSVAYFFRYLDPEGNVSAFPEHHGILMMRDTRSNEESIVWEEQDMSTLDALRRAGNSLEVFSISPSGNLILKSLLIQSDATFFTLFSFDLEAKTLRYMSLNSQENFNGNMVRSSDTHRIVWISQHADSELYIGDVWNDTFRRIAKVGKDESLQSHCVNLGCKTHDISFENDNMIRYAVYTTRPCGTSGVICDADEGKPVLRYETVSLDTQE